jgi:predicted anti-sigma-YlaC factor YlaD
MKHEDCRELLGELSNYLDREASARFCAEIEEHMANCEKCRIVVDTLRKTVSLYRQLAQPLVPKQARERLYKALNLADFAGHP